MKTTQRDDKRFVPPTPNYQEPDVYTIPKRMVNFIIEGFIRSVLADLRGVCPGEYELLVEGMKWEDQIRAEICNKCVEIMRERQARIVDIKYVRGSKIKVEFSDE